jgi:hypothetical protein
MPNEVVNKDDLHDVRDTLSEQMQLGFAGITARLDVLNGRVGKGEVADAVTDQRLGHVDQRLSAVEREILNRRVTDKPPEASGDDQAALTRRDLKVTVGVLSALYVLAQIIFKVLPMISKAVQP